MAKREFSDEELTAFLDGEADHALSERIAAAADADPSLAVRLESLHIPMSAIRDGFDAVADAAPIDRIEPKTQTSQSDAGSGWGRRWAIAACVALAFLAGGLADRFTRPAGSDEDWRVAVAEYQALYVAETLSAIDRPETAVRAEAARVGRELAADIPFAALASAPDMRFLRSQVLAWRGETLAQYAFLGANDQPIAFCVTRAGESDRGVTSTMMKGLALASWAEGGLSYMVIGGQDEAAMRRAADHFRSAL